MTTPRLRYALGSAIILTALGFLAPRAMAAVPADFGLVEGDTISANAQAGDPDVYIVNEHGFKRLFVNPAIFGLYGHLGFDTVKQVSAATRDAFPTSGLFRNCESGAQAVYGLEVVSEDVANLHHINMSGAQAVAEDPDFFQKVFCINNNEQALYGTGAPWTSLSQVPDYARGETGMTPDAEEEEEPVVQDPDGPALVRIRTSDDDRGSRVIQVDTSNDTPEVELYRFTIEERAGVAIWIESIEVTIDVESAAVPLDHVVERLRIKDDVTQYGNTINAKSAETVLFDGIDLHIEGGAAHDYYVEVDFRGNQAGSRYAEGEELVVSVKINEIIDDNHNEMEMLDIEQDAVSDVLELRSEDTIE